jgi:DTW domain-containing protein YfiP
MCQRCRRPARVCYCPWVPRIDTRTRVIFLQHPRERRMAVGTARMAHLALPNSELHVGVTFDGALDFSGEDAAVLFPGVGATDIAELGARPPRTLVVIDGTWPLARKVLKQNPALQRLPRIAFTPRRPGNYRIRREPAPHCVSTVEAVAEMLGHVEGDPERFQPMLAAFERMVDWQLEHRAERRGPPRRLVHKPRRAPLLPAELLASPERMVIFYAEANAYPVVSTPHFEPELVQWVAERPATGERFEAVVAPRVPLAPSTPRHLELTEETLRAGESLEGLRARWGAFVRADDQCLGWGHFSRRLGQNEGLILEGFIDLRLAVARAFRASPGELDTAAERLAAAPEAHWARGRAGRRIATLSGVARALLSRCRDAGRA